MAEADIIHFVVYVENVIQIENICNVGSRGFTLFHMVDILICSHSVLIETRVVHCQVNPDDGEIVIDYEMPDIAEVIRRGNNVPHVSDTSMIKVM